MSSILVAVDGSGPALRAVAQVLKDLAGSGETAEIHLLNVQPALPQSVTNFLARGQIETYHHDEGIKALAGARAQFDAAGTPYAFHIGVGEDAAQVIARYVREKRCDRVVMGTRGLGAVAGAVLGSVAAKTLHLVEVPVLLVK